MKKFQTQYVLTPDKLKENLEFFKVTNEKYKLFTDDLLEYLSDNGFFDCPASTSLNLYNCFPGGLLDHKIRVAKYAANINNKLLPDSLKQELTSIIKVSFLHGIGKVGIYEEQDSKWHRENIGSYYKYKDNQEQAALRVGERSAYLAMKYGVKLEDFHYQAILNSSKNFNDDDQAKYFSDTLTIVLRQAIELAILEEKWIFNNFNKQ